MPEAGDPSLVYVRSRPVADIVLPGQNRRKADGIPNLLDRAYCAVRH